MKRRIVVIATGLAAAAPGLVLAKDEEKERAEVRKAADNALASVYKVQPGARKAVESAAGYAAFSNFGMKILVAGGGTGKGIAVNNKTKAVTYMKMAELQAGIGFGVKKFQLVWVFDNAGALDKFVNSGWEIGSQATASAKSGDKGASYQGAVSVSPGVWLYQVKRRQPGAGAHRQGNEVLQGLGPQLRSLRSCSCSPATSPAPTRSGSRVWGCPAAPRACRRSH